MKNKVLLTTFLVSTLLLQSCISVSRGTEHPRSYSQEPTVGQELMDLDKARVSGAITGAEYDELKSKIIDNQE